MADITKEKDVLSRIIDSSRERVRRMQGQLPVDRLRTDPLYKRTPRDFRRAFLGAGLRVIAEVKFSSPSKGKLYPGEPSEAEAVRVASEYLSAGAAALSILTEPEYFKGEPEFLRGVRRAHPDAAILMKDFVVDVYQLHLARWSGADAVLLIAAALGRRLETLLRSAEALGLYALVEVHTEAEMQLALKAGAAIIGVNNRDLKTLKTDLGVARRLAEVPRAALTAKGKATVRPQAVLIAESGIRTKKDLEELAAVGYRGFLVGTRLMETGTPGKALKELLA